MVRQVLLVSVFVAASLSSVWAGDKKDASEPPAFAHIHGAKPELYSSGTLAEGHPHYELPSRYYSTWYRPRAFGTSPFTRCRPRPFRPRGYGNLFNPPATCHRLDYDPYALSQTKNQWGPSYYMRHIDEKCPYCCCEHCCCEGDDCCDPACQMEIP